MRRKHIAKTLYPNGGRAISVKYPKVSIGFFNKNKVTNDIMDSSDSDGIDFTVESTFSDHVRHARKYYVVSLAIIPKN